MSEQTKIQWCDSTVNFWSGCTKVSDGCAHCYAETLSKRDLGNIGKWGKGAPRQLHESAFTLARRLNAKPFVCADCGKAFECFGDCPYCLGYDLKSKLHRRRIFSLSLGDWLDPEVPIEWLARMLDTVRECDQVIWILCTKRPNWWSERLRAARKVCGSDSDLGRWITVWLAGAAWKHIWLLTSVENQATAYARIPGLIRIPAVVRGLSLEPLLGPVSLFNWGSPEEGQRLLHWLIIGGESGTGARHCDLNWIRSLIEQGKMAGVATFVKQIGANPSCECGEISELKHPKGGDPSEWPSDLLVRQFPL